MCRSDKKSSTSQETIPSVITNANDKKGKNEQSDDIDATDNKRSESAPQPNQNVRTRVQVERKKEILKDCYRVTCYEDYKIQRREFFKFPIGTSLKPLYLYDDIPGMNVATARNVLRKGTFFVVKDCKHIDLISVHMPVIVNRNVLQDGAWVLLGYLLEPNSSSSKSVYDQEQVLRTYKRSSKKNILIL